MNDSTTAFARLVEQARSRNRRSQPERTDSAEASGRDYRRAGTDEYAEGHVADAKHLSLVDLDPA